MRERVDINTTQLAKNLRRVSSCKLDLFMNLKPSDVTNPQA